jgi:hypothetical protein
MEIKVKEVSRQSSENGNKIFVTTGMLRLIEATQKEVANLDGAIRVMNDIRNWVKPYFLIPYGAIPEPRELPTTGDLVMDHFDDVHQVTENDGKEYLKTCVKIISIPNQISESILNRIRLGLITDYNKVKIEVELVVKVATDETGEDEIYYKIKYDNDGKVNVVSYESIIQRRFMGTFPVQDIEKYLVDPKDYTEKQKEEQLLCNTSRHRKMLIFDQPVNEQDTFTKQQVIELLIDFDTDMSKHTHRMTATEIIESWLNNKLKNR